MTGVSINCWRASIGLFNARYGDKTCKNDTYFLFYILTLTAMAFLLLRRSLIFQISFGLLVLFTYSAVVVILFPLILMTFFTLELLSSPSIPRPYFFYFKNNMLFIHISEHNPYS